MHLASCFGRWWRANYCFLRFFTSLFSGSTFLNRNYTLYIAASPSFSSSLSVGPVPGTVEMALGLLATFAFVALLAGAVVYWAQRERKSETRTAHLVEVSRLETARDTNNRIVGYVCHELRNPLHVLESEFQVCYFRVL